MKFVDVYNVLLIQSLVLQNLVGNSYQFADNYLAHGFNELDLLLVNLKKGVSMYKIDIAFVWENSCAKFSTGFNEDLCVLGDNDVRYCCQGLMGDTSSIPYQHKKFNTTDDFLNIIQSDEFIAYEKRLGKTMYIQVDLQMQAKFIQEASLFLNFLENLIKLSSNFDVQYFLYPCILDYFQVLCDTDSERCTNQLKLIINSKVLKCSYYGSMPSLYETQYNIDGDTLEYHCKSKTFPSWIYNSKSPMTIWEFSDEDKIGRIFGMVNADNYKISCPNFPMNLDWALTANIEPEKFEIYKRTFGKIDQHENHEAFGHFKGYLNPFIINKPDIFVNKKTQSQLVSFMNQKHFNDHYSDNTTTKIEYDFYSHSQIKGPNYLKGTLLKKLVFDKKEDSITKLKNDDGVVYGHHELAGKLSQFHPNDLEIFKSYNLPKDRQACQSIDIYGGLLYISCIETDQKLFWVTIYGYDLSSDYSLQGNPPKPKTSHKIESGNILGKIQKTQTKIFKNFDKKNTDYLCIGLSGLKTSSKTNLSTTYGFLKLNNFTHGDNRISHTNLIMFGSIEDLKPFENSNDNQNYLLAIHTHSACFSGNGIINNNDFTKCDLKKLDEDPRQIAQRVSNYSLRYLLISYEEVFSNASNQEEADKISYASLCSKNLMIGDLTYGDQSSIELIDDEEYIAFVVTTAVHPKDLDSYTKSFCGGPNHAIVSNVDGMTSRAYGFSYSQPIMNRGGMAERKNLGSEESLSSGKGELEKILM